MLSQNPFTDPDRSEIWEMLVTRDIRAYCEADWDMVANDFLEDEFFAVDGGKDSDPGNWKFAFSTLAHYRDVWVSQARRAQDIEYAEPLEAAVHRATRLEKIDIADGRAIARKQFNGVIKQADGSDDVLLWQTLYYLKQTASGWKICGFTGYLPYTA